MSVHDGHRQRMRERFLREGLDGFQEHEILEMLLFYCIPRQNTNELAHTLLERFGSLVNVMEATPAELKRVPGVGDNAATFLHLLMDLVRCYEIKKQKEMFDEDLALTTIEKCCAYLVRHFTGVKNEAIYLLCLDAKCKLLCCQKMGEGSINSAAVPVRRIVETAMNVGASSVIIAHNHPSGIAIPSGEDINTTRRLGIALNAVEIELIDHIVVAERDYVSMRQSGSYEPHRHEIVV